MKMQKKQLFTALLTAAFCVSSMVPAFAAESLNTAKTDAKAETAQTQEEPAKDFTVKYQYSGGAFSKISHPDKQPSIKGNGIPDGIVDYLGGGRVGVPGVDPGANGQGARGQSYSWASVAYGDWMYVSTCYTAMMSTIQGMGGMGHKFDPQQMEQTLNTLYDGDFFTKETDGANAGSVVCKVNVKTGETKILISKAKDQLITFFRNAIVYKDKIYFCGSVNGLPSVYQIDPKTDKYQCVYQDPTIKTPEQAEQAWKDNICSGIRGITEFNGNLVISCVGADANPYIAITSADNPKESDFTVIAAAYKEGSGNQVKGELLGYPVCRMQDAIYGGSIWEMVEFNNKLYVSMCTGKGNDDATDTADKLQSFAIMSGECKGDPTKRANWKWTPVIGDKEVDGAKYTFGIDPERTRSAACSMSVYNNNLYIGEYNDTEVALIDVLFKNDAKFLADNLEQSVSLYRMTPAEEIKKVMGDSTAMFPSAESGYNKSGFGKRSNQYIWQMQEFNGKLYLGTFDEASLLDPVARISNGEIVGFSETEWEQETDEVMKTAEAMAEKPASAKTSGEQKVMKAMLSEEAKISNKASYQPNPKDYAPKKAGEPFSSSILTTDPTMDVKDVSDLPQALSMAGTMLEQEEDWTLEERIISMVEFNNLYEKSLNVYSDSRESMPTEFTDEMDIILNPESLAKSKDFIRVLQYLQGTQAGFDMYVTGNGTSFSPITTTGMGDPYNHGLRVFAINRTTDNPWLAIGTANPFYGTQLWRMDNENVLPKPEKPGEDEEENKNPGEDPTEPEEENPNPEDPDDPKIPVDPDPDGDGSVDKPGEQAWTDKVVMTIGSKQIVVNNLQKTIDCAPLIKQSRTYVPFRALAEAFGADVDYYDKNQTIVTELGGTRVIMNIGSQNYTINGKSYRMDVSPFITSSRTMVPIRFAAEAFGIEVTPVYHTDGTTANVLFTK